MQSSKYTARVTFIAFLACGLWGALAPACAADPQRLNFVFILVDDLGRQDLGCEGSTFYETPQIDSLAARALRFENGYAACQVCSPSRAAIQTGRHPARLKITDYINPGRANQPERWSRNTVLLPAEYQPQLALDELTVAEALRSAGYHTFFAGKWHLGGQGFLPTDQGYEINRGGHEAGSPPGGFFSPYRNPQLTDGPRGEQLPLRLGRETADFIRAQDGERPFFAMLAFYSVHAPIQTTEELWKKYRDKAAAAGLAGPRQRFVFDRTQEVRQVQDNPLYAGMMESLDTAVGYVLAALRETGHDKDTVVIFTSDNGGVSSGDGYATSCLPLRGGKGRQWEGGIREPYYIAVPGLTQGTTTAIPATGMDFFPTILELADVEVPEDRELDGVSLVPVIRGESLSERPLFWHYPHYGNQGGEPSAIVRRGDWKLIHYFEDGRDELYDLAHDLGERQDLASSQPDHARRLATELRGWLDRVQASLPSPNPKYNAEARAAELQRLQNQGIARREREHASYLDEGFVPGGGWWGR